MRTPSAHELLDLWGQTRSGPLATQALAMLGLACPEVAAADLARLCVGQRDALLLSLRVWLFGARLDCVARCPSCGEPIEIAFGADEVRLAAPEPRAGPLCLRSGDYTLALRSPDSGDLLAVAGISDPVTAARAIFARCLLSADMAERPVTAGELPEEVVAAADDLLEAADPQARLELSLTCPCCGLGWAATFDIVSFLGAEIDAWAQRALREVHVLARAYGWREADILALHPWRRQLYLAMVD